MATDFLPRFLFLGVPLAVALGVFDAFFFVDSLLALLDFPGFLFVAIDPCSRTPKARRVHQLRTAVSTLVLKLHGVGATLAIKRTRKMLFYVGTCSTIVVIKELYTNA